MENNTNEKTKKVCNIISIVIVFSVFIWFVLDPINAIIKIFIYGIFIFAFLLFISCILGISSKGKSKVKHNKHSNNSSGAGWLILH